VWQAKVREAMRILNASPEQFASFMEVAERTVWYWLAGRTPRRCHQARIEGVLWSSIPRKGVAGAGRCPVA
jgi:hypothetical protein